MHLKFFNGKKQEVVAVTFTFFMVCMYENNGWQVECRGCAISVEYIAMGWTHVLILLFKQFN